MAILKDDETSVLDSLDLKSLLVATGVRYPRRVYDAVSGKARLEPPENQFACNCFILPGEVAVHLRVNQESPFALDVDADGLICLTQGDERLVPIEFPEDFGYYRQTTVEGNTFGSLAVLEGRGTLAFFYLWKCEYIRTAETCPFCFQVRADMAGFPLPSPTDEEVAEVIAWGLNKRA